MMLSTKHWNILNKWSWKNSLNLEKIFDVVLSSTMEHWSLDHLKSIELMVINDPFEPMKRNFLNSMRMETSLVGRNTIRTVIGWIKTTMITQRRQKFTKPRENVIWLWIVIWIPMEKLRLLKLVSFVLLGDDDQRWRNTFRSISENNDQ